MNPAFKITAKKYSYRGSLQVVYRPDLSMLHVYHSNRLEALFILLCTLRESRPLADPLTPEKVLVANPGIGRWLNFQIAERAGIAANIDYVLPATFVWQLYRDCLDNVPEQSAFEKNALRLRVLGELDAISGDSQDLWQPLQRYISEDHGGVGDTKRVQLASRIADVFDQYLVYRPQMLLDWEQGADVTPGGNDPVQRWQPALWRRLCQSVDEPHRAALWQQFCALADQGQIDPALLSPHLHLFNVGLLPPSTLDVLVRLAKVDSDTGERVSLYFLNPAVDYWADLLDMRRAARERLKLSSAVAPLADDQAGNPLLSSLGESGRVLMKLLGDRSEWVHDEQFFLPAADDSLLASVQADLLHPFEVVEQADKDGNQIHADESIQLHQCYSPVREVQALHDRLLDRFNASETLTPADVIVMVPDINRYAPVIEAVFGSVGGEPDNPQRTRHIPWSIADRALVQSSQVVACVQRLFELPGFEFEATGVLAFASEPAIARQFGFDDKALHTLGEWLRDAGVRRTLTGDTDDGVAGGIFESTSAGLHSWDFGLRRLLLGRAMPVGSNAVGEILPVPLVDGQQAALLSQLLDLLHALTDTRRKLRESHTPAQWVDTINEMITRFIKPDEDEADAMAQFRELLIALETDAISAGHTAPMSHATFAEILRGTLAGAQRKNHRYLTGRVTFSSMVPLRSVPFRMVCMLGLNDGDFPRQKPGQSFDLMAQQPMPGDRSVRDDDRYLFLEALLSARDELYLSWIYRNAADNAAREPSVLVSELRDYLAKRHPDRPPRCIEHPLQPFSARLFKPEHPGLHTFADEWAPPAEMPDLVTLSDTGSVPEVQPLISLEDFQRFWNNPSKWYCRRVLGIALWADEQEPEDAEPFDMNGLADYHLTSMLMDMLIDTPETDKAQAMQWLTQSGALPHGGPGDLVFDNAFDKAQAVAQSVLACEPGPLPAVDIDICINDQRLQGRMSRAVAWPDGSSGLLHFHAASLHGAHVSALWLAHLIGCAAGRLTGRSLLFTKDKERSLPAVEQEQALEKLQPWFEGWSIGQHKALPFFVKSSAIIAGAVKGNSQTVWSGSSFGGPGESEDEAVQVLYGNTSDLLSREEVHAWAGTLLGDEVLKP